VSSVCVGRVGGLEGGVQGAEPLERGSGKRDTYLGNMCHVFRWFFSAHGFCRWFSISG
jgi:hypothetical protein